MAQFSESDIDAAKRRVQEMRDRATKFTKETEETPSTNKEKSEENMLGDLPLETSAEKDKSFFIILALIFLLSNEGADNKLILALLYLLL